MQFFQTYNYHQCDVIYFEDPNKYPIVALLTCCYLICFVQGFEWFVMMILVNRQSNKTTEQLRHANYMRNCRRVRSVELCHKRIFYVLSLLVLGFSVFANLETLNANKGYGYEYSPFYYLYVFGPYQLLLFAFETMMFFWIYNLLIQKHFYEFQRNKDSMRF